MSDAVQTGGGAARGKGGQRGGRETDDSGRERAGGEFKSSAKLQRCSRSSYATVALAYGRRHNKLPRVGGVDERCKVEKSKPIMVSLYIAKHTDSKSLLVMSQGADDDKILQMAVAQRTAINSIFSLLPNVWKVQMKVFSLGSKQRDKVDKET